MAKLGESALKLLTEGKNVATVATIMPDGSPQSTAVWIDSDGEHVIFNTAERRVKTENLRRDPRVAITVWDADNPFAQASMRGRVVEMTTEGAHAHIDKLAKKYMSVDSYTVRRADEQRVIIKIEVD